MNFIHSTLDALRDRYAPVTHTSSFRSTGQITPEEFVHAGDFLVYKFPSWSWSPAPSASRRVAYLPDDKQFLITRGVPCHRRLDENYAGGTGSEDTMVREGGDGEEAWLQTGGATAKEEARKMGEVRTLDASGNLGDKTDDEEDEIPDMEDEEDDDAIIRDTETAGTKVPLRTYTLYITYTPYYRTPRLYLSGYLSASEPLPPQAMMEDIMGDYKDKTVTLEDFPFFDPAQSIKMASVHPCRHASVMKVLLDRADAALRLRREKLAKRGTATTQNTKPELGMEGLIEDTKDMSISTSATDKQAYKAGVAAAGGSGGDEWEVLQHDADNAASGEESAIRVDQYLIVFLKFISSVTPTIEHDFTMGV